MYWEENYKYSLCRRIHCSVLTALINEFSTYRVTKAVFPTAWPPSTTILLDRAINSDVNKAAKGHKSFQIQKNGRGE